MEDVITLPDLYLGGTRHILKVAPTGLAYKDDHGGVVMTVEKSDIKRIDMFRGVRKISVRVMYGDKRSVTFSNVEEGNIEGLRRAFLEWYGIPVQLKELQIHETLRGQLRMNQDLLEFVNEKTIFDIPAGEIQKIHGMKNELFVQCGNIELSFQTVNDLDIVGVGEDRSLATFESIQTLYPRGKMNYIFYPEYISMIGPTHSHRLAYTSVKRIYVVKAKKYSAIQIEPIKQGNTKYEFLVIVFDDIESDFEVNGKKYSGELMMTFVELIGDLSNVNVEIADSHGVRCVTKAYDGIMYLLSDSILFLPKAMMIPLSEVNLVEFSRINFSRIASKTFDMKIFGKSQYNFDNLPKDEFNNVEQYFSTHGIKARSEIIVEEIGSTDEEYDDNAMETTSTE